MCYVLCRRNIKKAQKEKELYWITVIENCVPVTKRITPSNKTNNCYSVSKVFTVTALGMLFDEGLLSVDERPIDILKDEINYNINKKWEQITLDNIIRHRWGIEHGFLDIDAENVNKFKENYGSRNDFLKNRFFSGSAKYSWCRKQIQRRCILSFVENSFQKSRQNSF